MSHQKISSYSILIPSTHCSAETFCSELKRRQYHGTNSNNIQGCWISREIPREDYSLLSSLGHSLLHGTSWITAANTVSKGRQICVKPSPSSFRLFLKTLRVANSFKFSTSQMSLEHGCSWQQKLQLSSELQPTWQQAIWDCLDPLAPLKEKTSRSELVQTLGRSQPSPELGI